MTNLTAGVRSAGAAALDCRVTPRCSRPCLLPGSYTVHVGDATGVALVEIYKVP
jgi:hypothetical protein